MMRLAGRILTCFFWILRCHVWTALNWRQNFVWIGHSLVIKKTDGGWLRKYGSLKSMEEELEGCSFLRIHKNYQVNQEYIKEVGSREVYLMDGSILEMGRDRKNAVREAMRLYDRERCRV